MRRRTMLSDRERLSQMRRYYRQCGYADGLAGRPAASTNAAYQMAWRRGREARGQGGAA